MKYGDLKRNALQNVLMGVFVVVVLNLNVILCFCIFLSFNKFTSSGPIMLTSDFSQYTSHQISSDHYYQ